MIFDYIYKFYRQSNMSFKALFGWLDFKIYVFVQILDPIMQLIFFCLLAKYVYGVADVTPWVVGNAILLCSVNAMYGVPNILLQERTFGTLKLVIASPANKFVVFVGRAFMHIFDAIFKVVIGFLIGSVLFGVRVNIEVIPALTLIILVGIFSAIGLGLLIGCIGLAVRDIYIITNTIVACLLALSGANFPVEKLPNALMHISYMLPLTRSIKASNILLGMGLTNEVYYLIFTEFLLGVAYTVISYVMLHYMERISRSIANLDIY